MPTPRTRGNPGRALHAPAKASVPGASRNERAQLRTGVPPVRFRPWLQAFRDYAFDRRPFGAKEIKEQITAAEKFGSDGWMLWNPRNVYSENGLSLNKDPGCR